MANHFLAIESDIGNAVDWLDSATASISASFGDDEDMATAWPEMAQLYERLCAIQRELREIIPPTVQKVIDDENAYIDEMADRADAMSY